MTGLVRAAGIDGCDEAWEVHDTRLAARDAVRARCSLWWSATPSLNGKRAGFAGGYSAVDADASALLLGHACARLAAAGCAVAVGPVDGDTWHRYRFVVERGDAPPFVLEPENPPSWPAWFEAAGFAPLAHYVSSAGDAAVQSDPRTAAAAARLRDDGVAIRPLALDRYEDELASAHALCVRAFARNVLASPIAFEPFAALYRPLRPLLDPELCLVAEHEGRFAGVLFALADPKQPDTVVLKTLARDPGRRYAGVGSVLRDGVRAASVAHGARRVVYALIHESNVSRNLVKEGVPFRRYAVWSKELS